MATVVAPYCKSAAVRSRLSRGSVDKQTAQSQPKTGTPCEVPVPRIVTTSLMAFLRFRWWRNYCGCLLAIWLTYRWVYLPEYRGYPIFLAIHWCVLRYRKICWLPQCCGFQPDNTPIGNSLFRSVRCRTFLQKGFPVFLENALCIWTCYWNAIFIAEVDVPLFYKNTQNGGYLEIFDYKFTDLCVNKRSSLLVVRTNCPFWTFKALTWPIFHTDWRFFYFFWAP